MRRGTEEIDGRGREAARLEALARVAGAAAPTSELDDVLAAVAIGVEEAFGLEVVLNLYEPEAGRFTVRAVTAGPAELLGTWSDAESWQTLLDPRHEIAPDVFFVPHEANIADEALSAVHVPQYGWSGPGRWHPLDMCVVRMRTSSDRVVGILSIDSSVDQAIPDEGTFELLRLFAMVGANAIENHLLSTEIASLEAERRMGELRRELAEKVEELQELNHHKDAFVAGVSHELRTPLTAIIGNVMTVAGLGDMLGAEERRELLVAAERQAKLLGELLENLLAESRLAGDDPRLNPVSVEVRTFVEEVADTLRFRAPGRVVHARVEGRPEIVTDRTLLYRVLFNLGDNALKYSDGPVTITARETDDAGVRFEVEDFGIGIEPEKLPLVFEQFSQVDPSDARKVGGVGLGLHLVRQATETLGGEIHVHSALGAGSAFSVWLPRIPPRQTGPSG